MNNQKKGNEKVTGHKRCTLWTGIEESLNHKEAARMGQRRASGAACYAERLRIVQYAYTMQYA
jgi:hypothetical protein